MHWLLLPRTASREHSENVHQINWKQCGRTGPAVSTAHRVQRQGRPWCPQWDAGSVLGSPVSSGRKKIASGRAARRGRGGAGGAPIIVIEVMGPRRQAAPLRRARPAQTAPPCRRSVAPAAAPGVGAPRRGAISGCTDLARALAPAGCIPSPTGSGNARGAILRRERPAFSVTLSPKCDPWTHSGFGKTAVYLGAPGLESTAGSRGAAFLKELLQF